MLFARANTHAQKRYRPSADTRFFMGVAWGRMKRRYPYDNTDKENVMYDNDDNDKENVMQDESSYTVEGTITKVTFANISKTSRVKRFTMHLYLTTPDSPNEDLKFEKKPAFESDKQLQIGQRVAITAIKDVFSEYSDIIHIEPL